MGATTHSIEVNAPLRAVYNQWAQFKEFPRFMEGVDEVRQEGPKSLFWEAKIGGKDKQWEAEITEQVPEKRIVWESVDGTPNRGEVTFESLDFERTRITLTMEYEPEGFLEKAGDAFGIPSGQVEEDLKRFRDFIEQTGKETGGWRGRIREVDNPDTITPKQEARRVEGATGKTGSVLPPESGLIKEIASNKGGTRIDRIAPDRARAFQAAECPAALKDEKPAEQPGAQTNPPFCNRAEVEAPGHEEIARRAYELYVERGRFSGYELEDWLEAEEELSEGFAGNSPQTIS